jgi:tetratricopeptide (TPR) repeat protein
MTPYVSYTRPRRGDVSLFVPLVVFGFGIGLLLWTLPQAGVRIPGIGRLSALVERIDFPWEPAKPTHVLLPEAAPAPAPAVVAQSGPAAKPETVVIAPAVQAPAAPAPVPAASAVTLPPVPASHFLTGFRHQWQTWNNCGPATITMATSFYGRPETQVQSAPFLKPNANDKNVGGDELVAYARSIGMRADLLYAGDLAKLKRLVSAGIPVVIGMWYTPHPNDGMGHYRLLTGYDDGTKQLVFHDSYQEPGVNVRWGYDAFDADWRVFNRMYIPVYTPEKADVVAAIVGSDLNEEQLRQRVLAVAQEEASAKPNDAYAWFNVGTALTKVGRMGEAVQAFDRARALKLPWRMLWYQFEPFEAYLAEKRFGDVIALTNANLAQAPEGLEESYYFRGRAQELQGLKAEARASYGAALRSNPKFAPAAHALSLLG